MSEMCPGIGSSGIIVTKTNYSRRTKNALFHVEKTAENNPKTLKKP